VIDLRNARDVERTSFNAIAAADAFLMIEVDDTAKLFTKPSDRRTEDYITGRFG